ncbi:unnamed protein product [Echinostoma caproni]|uniref:SAM domain-containing protein n=1 Tax=Echinostoma caproni TaxID=27848 RepID=A0A3P8GLA6_9TREM|nr:unnamed protein product [Echinostoma caproni]
MCEQPHEIASSTKSSSAIRIIPTTTSKSTPPPGQFQPRQQPSPTPSPMFGIPSVRPGNRSNEQPHSDSQSLPSKSPVPTGLQTSSPAQTPNPAMHVTQSVGSATHHFPGLFTCSHSHPVPQLPEPPPPGPVRYWSADDVVAFVRGTPGCGAYAEAFHTNEIDGEALLLLAEDQFIQPPIGMKIGPALKLAARLETLRNIS